MLTANFQCSFLIEVWKTLRHSVAKMQSAMQRLTHGGAPRKQCKVVTLNNGLTALMPWRSKAAMCARGKIVASLRKHPCGYGYNQSQA